MALDMSGFAQQQAEDARRKAAIAAQALPDPRREDAPVVETEAPDATKEIPQQHPSTRTGQTNSIPVVPTDLRHHKAWVLWKFERDSDKDKPRKVPYYIDGRRRSGVQGCGADRSALATYDRAAAQFQRGGYAGIGLAILPEWGLVALDFDKVVVDGQIQQDVQNLIDITYSEFSPSGTGVRAIFLGTVPANRKDNSPTAPFQVEFFSSKGFVTVTGEKNSRWSFSPAKVSLP